MPGKKVIKKFPIFAPFEVILHNTPHDCWLSFLGKVVDVTALIESHKHENTIQPLIAFAGKDVSHWFNELTGEIQHYVHPVTGVEVPFCPNGRPPDVLAEVPTTLWRPLESLPWWKNEKYQIGVLTKSVRPLRIVNMLTLQETNLKVCCEDTFERIQERFATINSSSRSYVWIYMDRKIIMSKTLDENDIPDDTEKLAELGIPKNSYIPLIRLYYKDDLNNFDDLSDDDAVVSLSQLPLCK